MFGRRLACLIVLLATTGGNLAAADRDEAPAGQRAYVETSYLIAPRQVGDFVLERSAYDPDRKYSGAGFRYAIPGHQEIRVDIYVYPAGKLDRATALSDGMEAFRADMRRAVDAGIYIDLRTPEEQEFMLADAGEAPAPDDPDSGQDDTIAGVVAAVLHADRPAGRKLWMTMNLQPQDWPMHSVGYLFYKNLYYFKLRASAAQSRISAEDFHMLTDLAARTLVPAIDVANIGDCANSVINVPADAPVDDIARALVTQAAEHQGYNCHHDAEAAKIVERSIDADVVAIAYGPEEWKSR